MAPTSDDVYKVLQSIDARLGLLLAHFGATGQSQGPTPDVSGLPAVAAIASDADLDGPYGNMPIRAKDPKDWTGDSQLGKPLSECPPEYLDLLAARYDYFATSNEDPKKRRYAAIDASRARGWAKRLRNDWKPPVAADDAFGASTSNMATADEIPF